MSDYTNLAKSIIKNIGGADNIETLEHCTTRLRFRLYDEKLANDDIIKNTEGVVTVMKAGGQYQVVVGTHVPEVYSAIAKLTNISSEKPVETTKKKKKPLEVIMDTVVGVMGPFIPLLTASGLIKGVNTLLVILGLYSADSGLYILLGAVGDAFFKFLPIFLGYSAAKKFGGTPFLGMLMGAILCYPTINGVDIDLFGYVVNATYTSTFFPILFTCLLAARVEKFFSKKLPEIIRTIFTPVLTMLICLPMGFALIGPFANFLGGGLTAGITMMLGFSPLLAGLIFGGAYQLLVVFGLHGLITTVVMTNVFSGIPDPITGLIGFASHAFTAMALAVAIKTRNKKTKQLAIPATITGFFGVTEPIIYGIALPNIKMFITASIAAAIGGAMGGVFGLMTYQFTGSGLIALLGYINPDDPSSLVKVLITWGTTFAVSFILSFIVYKEPVTEMVAVSEVNDNLDVDSHKGEFKREDVSSPLSGTVIPLANVKDEAFAGGDLGIGLAIDPTEGKVVAPFDGVVRALFPTKHAIGLVSNDGCEILIHIGMDTVRLDGQYFEANVKQGDTVKKGDVLITFDIDKIRGEGYSLETPVIVTNSDDYIDFIETNTGSIAAGENLYTILV
ncbi:beta-glucoside-specific PTS transporter subunit IIABC [uncultured Trichococcus sp.]|uniref:beta-glucoside-specific PTS transporter subunit IIABC n=1 Tax=uncultured Trichococcus sp. TaxID=189665 RepID=UPI002A189C26|nr:beta-glucoside-specific PTS transporter subunit IIABC [uncultured Trichococcus sp.]